MKLAGVLERHSETELVVSTDVFEQSDANGQTVLTIRRGAQITPRSSTHLRLNSLEIQLANPCHPK